MVAMQAHHSSAKKGRDSLWQVRQGKRPRTRKSREWLRASTMRRGNSS